MSTELTTVRESKMTLFGKQRAALVEVGIDLETIVDTYTYFLEQQKRDPEYIIPTYRAKLPSGSGKSFDIDTGDEDSDTSVPRFRGAITAYHSCNALFRENDKGQPIMGEPPVCQSMDSFTGTNAETGEVIDCAECPHNQWGTSRKGGKGKACKNMRRLYILAEGCDIPILLTLAPTSIRDWEKYKSAVLGVQRKSPQDVITEFSIATKKNADDISYPVVQFKAVGALSSETRAAVKALGQGAAYNKDLSADDYSTSTADDEPTNTSG